MYLVRTELTAQAGGSGELEAQISKLGGIRKGMQGYLGQTLLRSYGHPSKYAVTSRWDNPEAHWAFTNGQAFSGFAKGLGTAPGFAVTSQHGYDSVFEVDGPQGAAAPSTCEVLVDWTISQGRAQAFENSRRALFELRQKLVKGFVSARLRRSAGTPNRYLVINILASREDARAANAIPELQAFQVAHPGSAYASAPPVAEAYHVVHRI